MGVSVVISREDAKKVRLNVSTPLVCCHSFKKGQNLAESDRS
ncbi:hypothetical protein M2354_003053 [Leclercia adecarboxylata]|mgnify:CR=1 FL=1|jgi:hypothetical protein|nr:hypothetical protein [Leclercia adecarboxylata]